MLPGGREPRRRGRRGQRGHVVPQHPLERGDALRAEGRPGLLPQQAERLLDRPRGAVDAWRDQRVVDVADGEDPGLLVELARREPRG